MSQHGSTATNPNQQPGGGLRRFVIRALLVFALLVFCVGAGAGVYIWTFLSAPGSLPARDVELIIPPDTPFSNISRELQELGVIKDERRFVMLATWQQMTGKIRSGRFLVNTGWRPQQVLTHLVNDNPILDKITLPEGLTWWEVGKRLEAAGFVRFEDFKNVISDPAFLRNWGIPLKTAEGYLFPDTYYIMRPLTLDINSAKSVTGRLIDNFWRRITVLYEGGKKFDANDRRQVASDLILASIVEKETGSAVERARVAGVYVNRLNKKMLLQADPTTIYGIGPSFEGRLRRSDLNNADNPYNTYKIPGLPPGPICSPGLAALRAAMHPEQHSYLFFVSKGDGTHEFSKTLEEHNSAVRTYILDKKVQNTTP